MDRRNTEQSAALRDKASEASEKKRWAKPVLEVVELGLTAKTVNPPETGTVFGPS